MTGWNKYFVTAPPNQPAVEHEPKFLKQEVGYEHPAQGEHDCGECVHFKKPHSCEVVVGHIRSVDWCNRYKGGD